MNPRILLVSTVITHLPASRPTNREPFPAGNSQSDTRSFPRASRSPSDNEIEYICAVSLLAFHPGEPGSIPGRVTPRFSHVRIVPGRCRWSVGFLGDLLSLRRCSVLTSNTLIGSQDLAVKSRPNLFTLHKQSVIELAKFSYSYQCVKKNGQSSRGATSPKTGPAPWSAVLGSAHKPTTTTTTTTMNLPARPRSLGAHARDARTRASERRRVLLTRPGCHFRSVAAASGCRSLSAVFKHVTSVFTAVSLSIDSIPVYTELTFAIGSKFIRHALDDSAQIADLQVKKNRTPYSQMWSNTGATANEQTSEHAGLSPKVFQARWLLVTPLTDPPHVGNVTDIAGKIEVSMEPASGVISSTIPTCENPGATPPDIEPGSSRWEASSLTTTPPQTPGHEDLSCRWKDCTPAERLESRGDEASVSLLPSHEGNQGSVPGRVTPDFRKWEPCQTMPLVGGFSWGSSASPALSFRRCTIFTSITLIGSQDLDVESRTNLLRSPPTWSVTTETLSVLRAGAMRHEACVLVSPVSLPRFLTLDAGGSIPLLRLIGIRNAPVMQRSRKSTPLPQVRVYLQLAHHSIDEGDGGGGGGRDKCACKWLQPQGLIHILPLSCADIADGALQQERAELPYTVLPNQLCGNVWNSRVESADFEAVDLATMQPLPFLNTGANPLDAEEIQHQKTSSSHRLIRSRLGRADPSSLPVLNTVSIRGSACR
ncbi:hypothetical protein PR048_021255 [Dryococelus australis]|uniref:Uncharacterized protein n=1 Tax=Dryococelus australis TaxID=614101 RepID=A0ABQ9GXN8_9NEOP|nr:hypothetical protein PR048_021255 [Dryococelus australis]